MNTEPIRTPTDRPAETPSPRGRKWRLRVLLVVSALSLGLYGFVRLDRDTASRLGPVGEAIHDLFNQEPGKAAPLTAAAKQFQVEVKAMGAVPGVHITKPGFFGTFGQKEIYHVAVRNSDFDDASLARVAEKYGDKLDGLILENSKVTDAGLASLARFTKMRQLTIRNYQLRRLRPGETIPPPRITDAGMVHLKGLTTVWYLDLGTLPITDAGLDSIKDLPILNSLYLAGTKVEGTRLASMKSLARWNILYLNDTPFTEAGLKTLSGAGALQILSLNQVPLNDTALSLLKAIPRLEKVELKGCGFLDEEIADLIKSKPGLKVERR